MIESYSFGQILINGKKHNSDLIIFKDHIFDNWWRSEVIIKKTKDACDEYNALHSKKNIIAAFHLTC
jgi:hypothetical protein